MFLHPTQLDKDKTTFTLNKQNDTLVINILKDSLQPEFNFRGKDSIFQKIKVKSHLFKSASGNTINGWMIEPDKKEIKAIILFFHGNAGCIISQFNLMMPFVAKGYQVFMIDYSGFGYSSGKATKRNVLLDGLSAVDYLQNLNSIKKRPLIIYGQSLGGHLAVVVAGKKQSSINALVIEGAFSSHKDIAASRFGIFGRLLVNEQYSAKKSIQNFKKPVLIIHSNEDKVVPFDEGKLLFSKANEPKEFFEINKCHICGPLFYADEIEQKIYEMIR